MIGLVCFAIILANWFGGVRYSGGVPGGLIAIAAGTIIAWGSNLFGLGYGGLSGAQIGDAVSAFRLLVPDPGDRARLPGFRFLGIILVTAIPFGIYDLVEAMDNVESAAAAGDAFPTTQVLTRRRRHQPDRLPARQSLHQRRLHRSSGMEGDGRADRLFGGDRRHGPGADLARDRRARVEPDPGRRDPADPPLHRHADRLAGLPGIAAGAMRRRSFSR